MALKLWYDSPAQNLEKEALALGNGNMGCMIFGDVFKERIQFNEDSLWSGDQNPSSLTLAEIYGKYDTFEYNSILPYKYRRGSGGNLV